MPILILKEMIFFKFSIISNLVNIAILAGYAVLLFAAALLAKKLTKHQLLYA